MTPTAEHRAAPSETHPPPARPRVHRPPGTGAGACVTGAVASRAVAQGQPDRSPQAADRNFRRANAERKRLRRKLALLTRAACDPRLPWPWRHTCLDDMSGPLARLGRLSPTDPPNTAEPLRDFVLRVQAEFAALRPLAGQQAT